MADATSIIRLKCATDTTALATYTGYQGEPIFELENKNLYISDGTNNILIAGDSSSNSHVLATQAGLGASHTAICDPFDVLISDASNTAAFRRLTFDDLDTSGIHAMSLHSGSPRSIFYTIDTTWGSGNQVTNLSYGSLSFASSTPYYLQAYDNGGSNTLRFARLGYADLTGTITAHNMTTHSSNNAWRAYYSGNAAGNMVVELAFGASGTVFKSTGVSSAPVFSKLGFADITGVFTIGGSGGTAYSTLRSNGTSYVECDKVQIQHINDATVGINITGTSQSTITFNGGASEYGIIGWYNSPATNTNMTDGLSIISNDAGAGDIKFWTSANALTSIIAADVLFDTYSTIITKTKTLTLSTSDKGHGINVGGITATYSATNVRGVSGLKINSLAVSSTYAGVTVSDGNPFAGVWIDDMTSTVHASNTAFPDTAFIYCGNLQAKAQSNAYGIKIGSIKSQESIYGIKISDLSTSDTSVGTVAIGIAIEGGITRQGATIQNIAGLFVGTEIGDSALDIYSGTNTYKYAIYAKNGYNHFGGPTLLDSTAVGGNDFVVSGNSGTTAAAASMVLTHGTFNVADGAVHEQVKEITIVTPFTDQSFPSDVAGMNAVDIKRWNKYALDNTSGVSAASIIFIDEGYPGQVIDIYSTADATTGAGSIVFKDRGATAWASSNIQTIDGVDFPITQTQPIRLMCVPRDGTDHGWIQLNARPS